MSEDLEARRQIGGLAKAISQAAVEAQQKELEASQRKTVDVLSEMQGKMADKAAGYTNLILIGGYAGIFTVWSNMKATLPVKASILVASAILLSLTAFMGFEIYKMIFTARRFLRNRHLIMNPGPPQEFAKRLHELQRSESKLPLVYMPLWLCTLAFCILTAIFAGGVLGYNFVASLVGWSGWPANPQ